jgi:hypothetical protein
MLLFLQLQFISQAFVGGYFQFPNLSQMKVDLQKTYLHIHPDLLQALLLLNFLKTLEYSINHSFIIVVNQYFIMD